MACRPARRRHNRLIYLTSYTRTNPVTFDTHAQGMEARGQRRMNRGTRRRELLALRALLGLGASYGDGRGAEGEGGGGAGRLYDRVLVDSDCTHDGSARHLTKVAGLEERVYVHICVWDVRGTEMLCAASCIASNGSRPLRF